MSRWKLSGWRGGCALLSVSLLVMGTNCNENEIVERPFDAVAVVSGDFDSVELGLNRLQVYHSVYEGFMNGPAYEDGVDPAAIALKAETLFTYADQAGKEELRKYDAVFINSGARGFGGQRWNQIVDDDQFVGDAEVVQRIRDFVEADGRTLVVSDWAYDIVEAAWPDKVKFYGDESGEFDAAQVGVEGRITGRITSDSLKATLDAETISANFNYTNWAMIESVASDVEVLVEGDVSYRVSESEGYSQAEGVPLLIRFEAGSGQVIFSSMAWNAQTAGLSDAVLVALVDKLDLGSSEDVVVDTGASDE